MRWTVQVKMHESKKHAHFNNVRIFQDILKFSVDLDVLLIPDVIPVMVLEMYGLLGISNC